MAARYVGRGGARPVIPREWAIERSVARRRRETSAGDRDLIGQQRDPDGGTIEALPLLAPGVPPTQHVHCLATPDELLRDAAEWSLSPSLRHDGLRPLAANNEVVPIAKSSLAKLSGCPPSLVIRSSGVARY